MPATEGLAKDFESNGDAVAQFYDRDTLNAIGGNFDNFQDQRKTIHVVQKAGVTRAAALTPTSS